MPLNGFLGPSSETPVLTRILRHLVYMLFKRVNPRAWHIFSVPVIYYSTNGPALKEVLLFHLSLISTVLDFSSLYHDYAYRRVPYIIVA